MPPALLGHDLRAAVSDVIGGLRLIDHTALDPATRVQLERVRAAGETLARLMEEALAAMPAEGGTEWAANGHSADSATNLQLSRLLHDAEMRWSGRAREKGLGFGLNVGAGVPQVVSLHRMSLERILSNVLANAIKYTDAGTVELRVDLCPSGALAFRVCDAGPGFSPEALERLFQRGGRPGAAAKPGTGLGLHIAKEMADRMGGNLSVENRAEGGAEVALTLPRPAWAPADDSVPPPGLPDLSQAKVLLAEDNDTNQLLISQMLARLGAECVIAPDGIEALACLDRETFDLALIDIEMPRLTGIEVIREIRARGGKMATLPVVAVTAYVLRANREAIYAAGADMILPKPLGSLESFGHAVASVLSREGDVATEVSETPTEMDPDRFYHLIDIAGPEGAPELLRRLHTDLSDVERALVQAIAASATPAGEPDWAEIRAQSHVLIALSGAVGAEGLMQLARTLNASVHRRDLVALDEMGPALLEKLDNLIHFIALQSPPETRR